MGQPKGPSTREPSYLKTMDYLGTVSTPSSEILTTGYNSELPSPCEFALHVRSICGSWLYRGMAS